jgi:hypothetical protein
MSRWSAEDDEWNEEFDPDEDPSHNDDDDATILCPYCRRDIHEDSQRCPHCERYLSRDDAPPRKPWWMLLGVGACLYVVYRWTVFK